MNTLVSDIPLPPPTLRLALRLARLDLDRCLLLQGRPQNLPNRLLLSLSRRGMGVVLYRIFDCLANRGHRILGRIGQLLMYFCGRVEIHFGARIGPGLVLPEVGGVGLPSFCRIGRNCTFEGPVLLTIGGMEGIDLENDKIIIGDDCTIGSYTRIIGAITLGNGTQVKARSVVMTSFLREGYLLSGAPARRRAVLPIEQIRAWSPLTGQPLPGTRALFQQPAPAAAPVSQE